MPLRSEPEGRPCVSGDGCCRRELELVNGWPSWVSGSLAGPPLAWCNHSPVGRRGRSGRHALAREGRRPIGCALKRARGAALPRGGSGPRSRPAESANWACLCKQRRAGRSYSGQAGAPTNRPCAACAGSSGAKSRLPLAIHLRGH